MTSAERHATAGLAGIYGLRLLGMFIVLPVFALYAETLPGGTSRTLIGVALGAYGLTFFGPMLGVGKIDPPPPVFMCGIQALQASRAEVTLVP